MTATSDDSDTGNDLAFAILMIAVSVLVFLAIRKSERSGIA